MFENFRIFGSLHLNSVLDQWKPYDTLQKIMKPIS